MENETERRSGWRKAAVVAGTVVVAGGPLSAVLLLNHLGWAVVAACLVGPPFAVPILAHVCDGHPEPKAAGAAPVERWESSPVPAAVVVSRWCRGVVLFVVWAGAGIVLDAIVDDCDEAEVVPGTPISLRLRVPPGTRSIVDAFRWALEEDPAVTIELRAGASPPDARLSTSTAHIVLPLERSVGWPSPERRAESV
jgi:hypothetical protein